MTLDQTLAFAIIFGAIGLLIWGRIRYDLVALLALLASIACGIVKPADAFRGFSDDIVIIVGSALVVSAAISRSGLVESLMKPLVPRMRTSAMQVAVLASAVTALSAFVKNIGALAIFIPIALQVARRSEKPASRLLMPLSFGSLLGGLTTLIGTSPNIVVSRVREQISGEPFGMFDFAPVGVCLAVVGVAFLTVGWRLLPRIRKGAGATPETRFSIEDYTTEVRLPGGRPMSARRSGTSKRWAMATSRSPRSFGRATGATSRPGIGRSSRATSSSSRPTRTRSRGSSPARSWS